MSETKIRLVACDMDGTLLNDLKEKPEEFVPWVKAHPNLLVVIASGRQYETLRRDFEEIQDRLIFIADNGALVFHKNELVHIEEMDREKAFYALSLLEDTYGVAPIICGEKSAYMNRTTPNAMRNADLYYKKLKIVEDLKAATAEDRIVKIALFLDDCDKETVAEKLEGLDESLEFVVSGNEWIDIAKRGINKGLGIQAIQKKYENKKEESMAFGDYMNDTELLMACGESYAMENACPEIKSIARHRAPSNEEKGVMKVLLEREEAFSDS